MRGTRQHFWPDDTIFTTTTYKYDILANRMRELAYLNAGITITLTDERKDDEGNIRQEVFHSEHGLREFVRYIDSSRVHLFNDVIYLNTEKAGIPIEVAIMYNTSYSENLHSYVNNINTIEGGTHLTGFRMAVTRVLKKYAEDTAAKQLEKAKVEIAGEDFREGLTAVISVKVAEPQFEGQTKTKLGNSEVAGAVNQAVGEAFPTILKSIRKKPNSLSTRSFLPPLPVWPPEKRVRACRERARCREAVCQASYQTARRKSQKNANSSSSRETLQAVPPSRAVAAQRRPSSAPW